MIDDDKTYETIDATDLFDSFFKEIKEGVKADTASGKTLTDTLTDARLRSIRAAKLHDLLRYIQTYKAGDAKWRVPMTEAILLDDDFDVVIAAYKRVLSYCEEKGIAFLRACPEFARHGVLESLKVSEDTMEMSWRDLRKTMLKEDPNGAMMLQPFIPASSSAVFAPRQYAAFAMGHDGITAGSKEKMLYIILNPDDTTMSNHLYSLGHELGTYELEFVYQRTPEFNVEKKAGPEAFLTQIRKAPPHPPREPPFAYYTNPDTGIPVRTLFTDKENTVVDEVWAKKYTKKTANVDVALSNGGRVEAKEVWVASGLEEVAWLEENITKEQVPEGFVISHPTGSLMSHICAHAREHGIPYVVSEVEVGDRWTEGSPTWGALDPEWKIDPLPYDPCAPDLIVDFKRGLQRSQTHWQRQQGWLAHFFHQWAGMPYDKEAAFLAGGFCGWMAKAILALSIGEMRYAGRLKKNAIVDLWPTMTAMMGGEKWKELRDEYDPKKASPKYPSGDSADRKHYYAMMERINVDYHEIKKALQWCVKQFNTGWSGGFGGTAWAECAQRGVVLCEAIIEFTKESTSDTLEELLGAVNAAKNAEHNNGFLYGKWLHINAFHYSNLNFDKHSGTQMGLFPHSPDGISAAFKTYEVAKHFLEGEANSDCTTPPIDWMTLFTFLQGKGANYYRQCFITNDEEIPRELRKAAILCGPDRLHHGNKYSNKDNFIPCGIEDCKLCNKHDVIVMKLKYGKDIGGILLTPSYPEVFMAQGSDKSSIATYATVQLLRDKEYTKVTAEMWVDAWNGLNNQDAVFPVLSEHLTKFAKNQMGDDKTWTDSVLKILKEESE